MSDVDELVAWLRQQLDEDERVAREAAEAAAMTRELPPPTRKWAHIARHDPARVLAEVAAKRAILDLHQHTGYELPRYRGYPFRWICQTCGSGETHEYPTPWPCQTLRLLAGMYAHCEGYRDEWRPS